MKGKLLLGVGVALVLFIMFCGPGMVFAQTTSQNTFLRLETFSVTANSFEFSFATDYTSGDVVLESIVSADGTSVKRGSGVIWTGVGTSAREWVRNTPGGRAVTIGRCTGVTSGTTVTKTCSTTDFSFLTNPPAVGQLYSLQLRHYTAFTRGVPTSPGVRSGTLSSGIQGTLSGVSLSVPAPIVSGGTVVPLTIRSTYDGDPATLTYTATSSPPVGMFTFDDSSGISVPATWTAPPAALTTQTVTLRVIVGGRLVAQPQEGSVTLTVQGNRPPVVSGMASPTSVAGGNVVTLTATASDPDGQRLSYMWTAAPSVGEFGDASALSTTWTAPRSIYEQTVTLTLRVTDALSVGASSAVEITVTGAPIQAATTTRPVSPEPTYIESLRTLAGVFGFDPAFVFIALAGVLVVAAPMYIKAKLGLNIGLAGGLAVGGVVFIGLVIMGLVPLVIVALGAFVLFLAIMFVVFLKRAG